MKKGKGVKLSLLDAKTQGRIRYQFPTCTEVVYRIPRTLIEKGKYMKALSQEGVYFLFEDSHETEKASLYIGMGIQKKGERVIERLLEHHEKEDKDAWKEVFVVSTVDDSLEEEELFYLANAYTHFALEGKNCLLKNSLELPSVKLAPEREEKMQGFLERTKFILKVCFYGAFQAKQRKKGKEVEKAKHAKSLDQIILTLPRAGLYAKGRMTAKGFVVLAGSRMRLEHQKKCPKTIVKKRNDFLKNRDKVTEDGILLEDKVFKSPYGAASFLLGSQGDAWKDWKDEEGVCLDVLDRLPGLAEK